MSIVFLSKPDFKESVNIGYIATYIEFIWNANVREIK